MNPIEAVAAVRRVVAETTRDGRPARAVIAERTYPAERTEVWDALTDAVRIPRWLLPITGDLRVGGRYQLEGNAGGTITTCEPPVHLAVTWEFGGGVTWVDVRLDDATDGPGTRLRLEHVALVDHLDQWDEFGPGAVGVGWDLSLLGLAEHLATGEPVRADLVDPGAIEFMRAASAAWGVASTAAGTPVAQAEAAAARTTAAYTGG